MIFRNHNLSTIFNLLLKRESIAFIDIIDYAGHVNASASLILFMTRVAYCCKDGNQFFHNEMQSHRKHPYNTIGHSLRRCLHVENASCDFLENTFMNLKQLQLLSEDKCWSNKTHLSQFIS